MALRFDYPSGEASPEPVADLLRAPVLKPAVTVGFRRGASVSSFVADVMAHPHVKVDGATAAGKTTTIPKMLAGESGKKVFYVTAHPLLAHQAYRFCVENPTFGYDSSGMKVEKMSSSTFEPQSGALVWCDAPMLVAWLLARKGEERPLDGVVVYLDEAHESDAYTHVIRSLVLAMGAYSLVLASATFDPDGHRVSDSQGVVNEGFFEADSNPADWDVLDTSKPWSYVRIREAGLLFVDSSSAADSLVAGYQGCGLSAYRLTSKSKPSEFDEAVAALGDPRGSVAVLVLDSSFRSGFNFHVTDIVDSGVRYYVDSGVGQVRYASRPIYEFERVQTANRGGRSLGAKATYSRPKCNLESMMCDLEDTEAEAAAYLFRCLGFSPVGRLAGMVMSRDELPSTLSSADVLRGCYPVSYYCRTASGKRREGVVAAPYPHSKLPVKNVESRPVVAQPVPLRPVTVVSRPSSSSAADVDSEVASIFGQAMRQADRAVSPVVDVGSSAASSVSAGEDVESVWRSVMDAVSNGRVDFTLDDGFLYCPDSVGIDLEASAMFPEGHVTLMDMVAEDKLRTLVGGFSGRQRLVGIRLALERYNMLMAECLSIRAAMVRSALGREHVFALSSVRRRLSKLVSIVASFDAERRVLSEAAVCLAGHRYDIKSFNELPGVVNERTEKYVDDFDEMLDREVECPSGYTKSLEKQLSLMPLVTSSSGSGRARRKRDPGSQDGVRVVKPSRWTGVSEVVYDDSAGSCVVKPNAFVRMLTGVSKVESRDSVVTYRHK